MNCGRNCKVILAKSSCKNISRQEVHELIDEIYEEYGGLELMQSQFTDKAQNALAQASRCARSLKQGYIGTEHILVGLLKEDTGVAAKVLADNGVETGQVMDMIRDLIAFENGVAVKDREGYSPRAARILRKHTPSGRTFSDRSQTGTEHLLLALIKEGENVAVCLLNTLGANGKKNYVDTLIRYRTGRQSVQRRPWKKGRP